MPEVVRELAVETGWVHVEAVAAQPGSSGQGASQQGKGRAAALVATVLQELGKQARKRRTNGEWAAVVKVGQSHVAEHGLVPIPEPVFEGRRTDKGKVDDVAVRESQVMW
jgi:hypothetical protein